MVKQINLGVWPSGDSKPLMVIATPISELSQQLGLKLQRGLDDLDEYTYAVVELSDGSPAMIHHYNQEPLVGTYIYVDVNANTDGLLDKVKSDLLCENDKVEWEQTIN